MGDGESLRGLVIEAWEKAGRPHWTVAETIEVTERIDDLLERDGRGRAQKFRVARLAGDRKFVKSQVRGNRYEWLKPRFGSDALPVHEAVERQLAQTLNKAQHETALRLLNQIRSEIQVLSEGDPDLAFRIRRFIHQRLQLDGRPPRALQRRQFDKQHGGCDECKEAFAEITGTHLHRTGPGAYAEDNTVLLHPECHREVHRRLGASAEPD